MEQSLAAVSLAVVICSLPQEFRWMSAVLPACALACICGAFWVEYLPPLMIILANSWLVAPKQILLFSAMFLAALASHAGASEHISHLALTTLFWEVSTPKHDRKEMLALVLALQLAQTALVCGAHLVFHPVGASTYLFFISAGLVGILLPSRWLLLSWRRSHGGRVAGAAGPPKDAIPSEPAFRSAADDILADCSCVPGSCRLESRQAPPHRAALPLDIDGAAAQATESGVPTLQDVHFRQQTTMSKDCADCTKNCPLDSVLCTQAGHVTPTTTSYRSQAPPTLTTSTSTIACQTDDELLLWLFAGASTAPSAVDEVRDEPRASYSGILSSLNPTVQNGELWGSRRKDGSSGDGNSGCFRSQESGGDGGRSGGVGKFDSFTSVWSRCTGGGYGSGVSAGVSMSDVDVLEGLAPVAMRYIEEGHLGNGSQQGYRQLGPPSPQQPELTVSSTTALIPAMGLQAPWHSHSHQAGKQSSAGTPGTALPGAQPSQLDARETSDGGGGSGGGGANAGPHPFAHLLPQQHHQCDHQQQHHYPSPQEQQQQQSSMHSQQHRTSPRAQLSGSARSAGAFNAAVFSPLALSAMVTAVGSAARQSGTTTTVMHQPGLTGGAAADAGERIAVAGVTSSGSGFGTGSGATMAANRALAQRERLQRSRTFNALSPERSRVLMELATTDSGELPPPELDEGRLGSVRISVPSPYSDEESENETTQQVRALRTLRRFHPELAVSLERFAALLKRRKLDASFAGLLPTSGLETVAIAGAADGATLQSAGLAAEGLGEGAMIGKGNCAAESSARGRGPRLVRRTQSFSCAVLVPIPAALDDALQQTSLRRSFSMQQHHHHQQHQQLCQGCRHLRSQMGTAGPRFQPNLHRAALETELASEVRMSGLHPELVDASELPLQEPRISSSDGYHAGPDSIGVDAVSELSFDQQLLAQGSASAAAAAVAFGIGTTASRRWSNASSSISSATIGSRGERMSMSAAEPVTHGSSSSEDLRCTPAAVGTVECARRAHQVQRSRSAGEAGFRSSEANRRDVRRPWSQLPHQEHRRASLLQAWQTMMTEGGWPCSSATASSSAPLPLPERTADHKSLLPYRADPHSPPAGDVGRLSGASATSASPTGAAPTSPPAIAATVATVVIGTYSSGDGSGPSLLRSARNRPVSDAPGANDDRSLRLCKSLSERSLQQRMSGNHQHRRVARTKSRFALLQEPGDGNVAASRITSRSPLPRISSGDSMGSRLLENVLEEQEQEEEDEDGLLAAATSASGSGRGSAAGRRSANGDAGTASGPSIVKPERVMSGSGCGEDDNGSDAAIGQAAEEVVGDADFDTVSTEAAAAASRGSEIAFGNTADGELAELSIARADSPAESKKIRLRPPPPPSLPDLGRDWLCSWEATLKPTLGLDRRMCTLGNDSSETERCAVRRGVESLTEASTADAVITPASMDGVASFSPSLLGSRGSRGGGGGGGSSRPSASGIVPVDSLMGRRDSRHLVVGRGSGRNRGHGGGDGGAAAAGSSAGRRHPGGSVSADGGMDSDEELLDVLADEVGPDRSPMVGGSPVLHRLQDQGHGSAPGKTASFRFAAPIVPTLSPPLRTMTAGLQRGAEHPPLPPLPPPPLSACPPPAAAAPHATTWSPPGDNRLSSAAVTSQGAGDPAARAAAAGMAGCAEDDIPVPPLAVPILPELERERTRERPMGQFLPSAAGDVALGASSSSATSGQHSSAAAVAVPHTAPLSAQNLQHHTRHWEAASPAASNPVALALQLPSPSPSQSGPIDPLSDGDAAPSAALLAVLQNAVAGTAGVGVSVGTADADGGSSQSLSPQLTRADGGTLPHGSGPVPRSVLAARLSMPLIPYGNPDATAALVAAAGRNSTTSMLSRQANNNTISALSACESGSIVDAMLMPSGDDLAVNATATAVAAQQQLAIEHHRNSVISRTPSILVSGSNAGRSIVVRINSGGAAAATGAAAAGPFSGIGAMLAPRPAFAPSTVRQPSKLSGGAALSGGDAVEHEVEEAVLANRRLQDDRGVLLEEISIDKVLGFGSMGMVYHGRLYDTKVVVKLIEHGTGVLGKEKERGRLARVEACVSRMLLHPNVVLTYDACTGSLQPGSLAAKLGRGGGAGGGGRGGRQRFMTVMVQEFCELGTLKDAVSKRKHGLAAWTGASPSPEALALLYRVALDIANGMKHLAALRIIHADLKAENVLLQKVEASSDRPHGFCAKVADFGLAMVLSAGDDDIRQGIHGTVSHMPPEAMKDTVFSLATDVFSFGVVLWELYTTESPYRGMAPHEVVEAVCVGGERPTWPSESPPDLVALAEDCWHTDPHQRPSFADVVERLRQLLAPSRRPPERCASLMSGLTEESDELEMALRQQRRGAPGSSVRGGGGGAPLSETGSDFGAGHARQGGGGIPTQGSSRGAGVGAVGTDEEGVGVPRVAPRDPLGLLLWALCQFPGETPLRVEGPSPDSEQWVMQMEDMVLKSRQEPEEEANGGAGIISGYLSQLAGDSVCEGSSPPPGPAGVAANPTPTTATGV